MAKKKYNTIEERKEANKRNAINYYHKHKNDPEFMNKRRAYYEKYYSRLNQDKKNAYKSYNTDYVFYIKNVRTGLFELKITRYLNKFHELGEKIKKMEDRLAYLRNKFGHLENK